MDCPLCSLPPGSVVLRRGSAVAVRGGDGATVPAVGTPDGRGLRTLVVTRRHVASWFDATAEERQDLLALVDLVKEQLDRRYAPDGYNIALDVGAAAGQRVMHLHLDVTPRFEGDHAAARKLSRGGRRDPFFGHLRPLFARASRVDILAAFTRATGVEFLRGHLRSALERGARVRVLTGDYLHVTQADALGALLDIARGEALDTAQDNSYPPNKLWPTQDLETSYG